MSRPPNPVRGEARFRAAGQDLRLRPSFENLVAAEEELGSLFALVERASEGALTLHEMTVLLFHCIDQDNAITRSDVGEAVVAMGFVAATEPVRAVLTQVLQGRM